MEDRSVFPIIMFKISISVWRIPSRPMYPMAFTVSSAVSMASPSPASKRKPFMARLWPRKAACREEKILAAQLGFAPSQVMPPALTMVLITVFSICSAVPPHR